VLLQARNVRRCDLHVLTLGALLQHVIDQHQRKQRLDHRHGADADTRIVTP
jgi:hypothetical protein